MKKKISIHDLAKQLGVSAATISYVINGKSAEMRISREMEKKILQFVETSGYRPNRVAKSLRTGKSKILGLLVEDISDPFFATIARIIELHAHRHDYKIFHASTENDPAITRSLLQVFRDTQVDAYIIAPPIGVENDIDALMEDNKPVVLFDRFFPALNTFNVIVNNVQGAGDAVRHLISNGYSRIGMVTLDSEQTQMHDRLCGYMQAMNEHHLPAAVLKIAYQIERERMVVAHVGQYLDKHEQLDALLFSTNYLAIGGLEAMYNRKMKIPEDIAVVGFDDNTYFSLFSPSITAVAQPVEAMAEAVMAELMKVLSGKEKLLNRETIVLPTRLIVRQSSARAI